MRRHDEQCDIHQDVLSGNIVGIVLLGEKNETLNRDKGFLKENTAINLLKSTPECTKMLKQRQDDEQCGIRMCRLETLCIINFYGLGYRHKRDSQKQKLSINLQRSSKTCLTF